MVLRYFALLVFAAAAFGQTAFAQSSARVRSATIRRITDRAYLGVGVIDMTPTRARELKLPSENGVEIKRVDGDSPASKAGLHENDVILEVNAKAVEDGEQFVRLIAEATAGTKVNLTVWRNNAKITVAAMLESRPPSPMFLVPDDVMPPFPDVPQTRSGQFSPMPGQTPLVGFDGETLTDQLAQFFGVKEGVLVRSVGPRTPAEKAGLRAGDVVVKVNGTPVTSPREISGMVNSSRRRNVTFSVVRNKKEITLEVEIAGLRPGNSDRDDL